MTGYATQPAAQPNVIVILLTHPVTLPFSETDTQGPVPFWEFFGIC